MSMSEQKEKYDRGSALSIFGSDRKEDFTALILALAVALYVYVSN
jgi:hypothetical protein